MGHFVDQPWWVNLTVVLLPFVFGGVAYYLIRGRSCVECGHQATQLHQRRHFCDRCFRTKFGAIVAPERSGAPSPVWTVMAVSQVRAATPATVPVVRNGKRRRRVSKKAG